jgi:hypothetical protein
VTESAPRLRHVLKLTDDVSFPTDAPTCRSSQQRVHGVAKQERAHITCHVDANPPEVVVSIESDLSLCVSTHQKITNTNHHHQPINVPTAGAQDFLMGYPQRERDIAHHAGPVWIGGC